MCLSIMPRPVHYAILDDSPKKCCFQQHTFSHCFRTEIRGKLPTRRICRQQSLAGCQLTYSSVCGSHMQGGQLTYDMSIALAARTDTLQSLHCH